jgi:hypothetical protein
MKRLETLLLMMLFCPALSGASDIDFRAGICGAKFLKIGMGARPAASGRAFVSVADDANSVFWNPAGLGRDESRSFSFSHNEWLADIKIENISYVVPGNSGTLAYSLLYTHMDDIVSRGLAGEETGVFAARDTEMIFSYGYMADPSLVIGANLKLFQESVEQACSEGVAFDLGVIGRMFSDRLSIGACMQNSGPWLKTAGGRETLPWNIMLGAGYALPDGKLVVSGYVSQPYDNAAAGGAGIEWKVSETLKMRGGYAFQDAFSRGLTGGFGLKVSGWLLDYAYAPSEDFGAVHYFTLTLQH